MPDSSTRVHLVLGAGGVKCLSYAGAISKLTELGLEIATISSASAGSLFGALLAAGMDPARLPGIVDSLDLERLAGVKRRLAFLPFFGPMWRWPFARYRESGFAETLRDLLGADPTFRELGLPFATIGIDIVTRRLLVYSTWTTPDMKVAEALRIAIAVPFLYPPHDKDGRLVVDGALASQFPVWLATEHAEPLPIVILRPRTPAASSRPTGAFDLLSRVIEMAGASRDMYLTQNISRTLTVDIDVGEVTYDRFTLSRDERRQMVTAGSVAAEDSIRAIQAMSEGAESYKPEPPPPVPPDATDDDRAERGAADAMASFNATLSRRVRDQVFISYAHEDREWLDKIQTALKPYVRNHAVLWSDTKIRSGSRWQDEIGAALRKTKVALLLVTKHFLASDFVIDVELREILRAAEEEGIVILWVAVGASAYEETALRDYQAANDPARPLNGLSEAEQDLELVNIGKQVKMALS